MNNKMSRRYAGHKPLVMYFCLLLVVLLWLRWETPVQATTAMGVAPITSQQVVDAPGFDALLDSSAQWGMVPVIIGLNVPGYQPDAMFQDVTASSGLETAIANAQETVLQALAGHAVTAVKQFHFIPYMALATDIDGLRALRAQPTVLSIVEDRLLAPALDSSLPLIRADDVRALNFTGEGVSIAILDTGVDRLHPSLRNRVVAGACFSTNIVGAIASLCPGGVDSATTLDSGRNCPANVTNCDHGTHVAGIAAAVASEANILAVQVFSRVNRQEFCGPEDTAPCTRVFPSDIIRALEHIHSLRNTFTIAAINMSFGVGDFPDALSCGLANLPLGIQIGFLRDARIAVVAAAGNEGFRNSMGSPACIDSVISVGATTDSDQVAGFSNISLGTTLLAPGVNIVAPVPGTGTGSKSGTSMAAPHVAGAIAILRQAQTNLTVNEIKNILTTTGPFVTDARVGGFVTKRRLDVFAALCRIITCDSDDFRTISNGQTLAGNITPTGDIDFYTHNGVAGARVTLRVNTTSNLLPRIDLFDPLGNQIATNAFGGGGNNALINNFALPQTGRYQIRVHANLPPFNPGSYQLSVSSQPVVENPRPAITQLTPGVVTANLLAGDFTLRITGINFMRSSVAQWNGSSRPTVFQSANTLFMTVRGDDIRLPGSAQITVRNPAPGGGTSTARALDIVFAFLGESKLLVPAAESSTAVGLTTTFAISWTHPTDSWRVMQNMDLHLRNDEGTNAAWIRFTEAGPTTTLSLLNSAGTVVMTGTLIGGVPSIPQLTITDTVTLHLDKTSFQGSGRTIIFTPTLTFGPAAVGAYNIGFRVDNEAGEIQDDDVLGIFRILSAGCSTAVQDITISGPAVGAVNTEYTYAANILPADASTPITYTWSPEPASGQGSLNAIYRFATAGRSGINVVAENCGGFAAAAQDVAIQTQASADLKLSKQGPATAVAGSPITYTLTLANHGGAPASQLTISDEVPTGATYVSGGTLNGNRVSWSLPTLNGFGTLTQTQYVVTAQSDITNSTFAVTADGGLQVTGVTTVATHIVDAQIQLTPVTTGTLTYHTAVQATIANAPTQTATTIVIPAGAVFANTTVTYEALGTPQHPLPDGKMFVGIAFALQGYAEDQPVTDFVFNTNLTVTIDHAALGGGVLPQLYRWTGSTWSTDGVQCENPTGTQVVCTLTAPIGTGEYVLLMAQGDVSQHVYLPLINR